jgi:hypothetical protein
MPLQMWANLHRLNWLSILDKCNAVVTGPSTGISP